MSKREKDSHEYELISYDAGRMSGPPSTKQTHDGLLSAPPPRLWRPLLHFTSQSPLMLLSLALGLTGAFAVFAFTYWLSSQNFTCPPWTTNCEVKPSVHWFADRLGLLQGLVSTIYGMCISGMAYAAYQLAETTLWPILCMSSLSLKGIDRFLQHSRGALSSFPYAIWGSRRPMHVTLVLVVGIVTTLLQINSTIVGWAFSATALQTHVESNHTQGGGMGFGFIQSNPPLPFNGEYQRAYTMYSAWSNSQSVEMLPDLRDYIIDRQNLSAIGNFTVGAVQATRKFNCYAEPIEISKSESSLPNFYAVKTHLADDPYADGVYGNLTWLRFTANAFTSFVDSYEQLGANKAKTKIVFAALNGTIQGGHLNEIFQDECSDAFLQKGPCSGISTLACDVEIELVQGQACNGDCALDKSSNLTWVDGDGAVFIAGSAEGLWPLAVAIASAATQVGPYVYGAQPAYAMGTLLPNATHALPVAWSDNSEGGSFYYSQANLTNFIDVAAGAMCIAMPQGWPAELITIESTLELFRLKQSRAYVLLVPPAVTLLSIAFIATASAFMHRRANIRHVKLGWTSEILLGCTEGDVMAATERVYHGVGSKKRETLDELKLRYDWVGESRKGLVTQGDGVVK